MDTTLRVVAMPTRVIWDVLSPSMKGVMFGDNEAMLQVIKTGRNPTMRYLSRTHRVSISWLNEVYKAGNFKYKKTDEMAADIFTKAFANPVKRLAALKLISIDVTSINQTPSSNNKNHRQQKTPHIQHHANVCALSFVLRAMASPPSAPVKRLLAAGFKLEGQFKKRRAGSFLLASPVEQRAKHH